MSIGEALAEARREAGLTVAQVSQRTRIRQTIIRGIEGDDYSVCGGDFYARGHIRSIAKVVAADPGPLIEEFDTTHRAPGALSATAIDELVAQSRRAGRRRSWAIMAGAVTIGLALLAAAGFVGYRLLAGPPQAGPAAAGGHGAGQGTAAPAPSAGQGTAGPAASAGPAATASPAPTASPGPAQAAAPAAARALTPVRAAAAGPGGGDNPQFAYRAIDASHATAWRTDWYTTARFGNLYPGTGLRLDMGHPVTLTGVRISLGRAAGAALQVRVGAARGLAQRPPAARAAGSAGVLRLRFSRPAHGRYVLLWFTRLPADPAGTFQASVYNIKLTGS